MALDDAGFARGGGTGVWQPSGRHAPGRAPRHPLVAVYAERFWGPRFCPGGRCGGGHTPSDGARLQLWPVWGGNPGQNSWPRHAKAGRDLGETRGLAAYAANTCASPADLSGHQCGGELFTDDRAPPRRCARQWWGLNNLLPPVRRRHPPAHRPPAHGLWRALDALPRCRPCPSCRCRWLA